MSNRILALLVVFMVATSWARVVDFDYEEKRECKGCGGQCQDKSDCCHRGWCENGKCHAKGCIYNGLFKRMLEYMKKRNEELQDTTNDHYKANDDDMPYEY